MDGVERQMSAMIQPSNETPLQKEHRLFRELWDRLINALLNAWFDLRPARAQSRARNLLILFLLTVFLITLIYYPLGLWADYLQQIFLYFLNPNFAASATGNPLT